MLKRILLSSALALLGSVHQASHASDVPAWGLIVKLKSDASAQPLTDAGARAQASGARVMPSAALAQAQMQATLQHAGLASIGHRTLVGAALHHVGSDRMLTRAEAQAMAARLMASGDVEWAVPNERERLQAPPPSDQAYVDTDPVYRQWWALPVSGTDSDPLPYRRRGVPNLTPAWARSTGSASVTIAVLDTGLTTHPDLATARLVPGRNFHHNTPSLTDSINANDTSDPGDAITQAEIDSNPALYQGCIAQPRSSWHGTAVTGVIAATANGSNIGIAGSDWAAKIMPVRVAGRCGAWESDILDAMNWVAGDSSNGNLKRADIVNLSFGGDGTCDPGYITALQKLKQRGVVVVVAAGNSSTAVARPANCSMVSGTSVMAVAALNRDGFKANYSNFGAQVTVATVGGDFGYQDASQTQPLGAWGPYVGDYGILTLGNQGTTSPGTPDYYYYSGTSLAAPIVSATLSLMLSVNAGLPVTTLIQELKDSTRPHVTSNFIGTCSSTNPGRCLCTTQTCGAGILDTDRALQAAAGLSLAPLVPEVINNADVQAAAAMGQDTVVPEPTPQSTTVGPNENKGGGGGSSSLAALLALACAIGLMARQLKSR